MIQNVGLGLRIWSSGPFRAQSLGFSFLLWFSASLMGPTVDLQGSSLSHIPFEGLQRDHGRYRPSHIRLYTQPPRTLNPRPQDRALEVCVAGQVDGHLTAKATLHRDTSQGIPESP